MSTSGSDNDKTIGEAVTERAEILENTFNLSPETAKVAAQDKIAKGMRNPGSAAVETERASDARNSPEASADDER